MLHEADAELAAEEQMTLQLLTIAEVLQDDTAVDEGLVEEAVVRLTVFFDGSVSDFGSSSGSSFSSYVGYPSLSTLIVISIGLTPGGGLMEPGGYVSPGNKPIDQPQASQRRSGGQNSFKLYQYRNNPTPKEASTYRTEMAGTVKNRMWLSALCSFSMAVA